jgi:AraC-like DNA-binding protein
MARAQHARGALLEEFLIEEYRYPAGTTTSHAPHEYQICLGDGPPNRYCWVAAEPPSGPSGAVQMIRAYLEDHYAANVSLEDLAGLANLSPFHLARLFRREVGMAPHAYQLQVRLAHAKRMLLHGVPASMVASETGFFDLSHFTRHFKRHLGVAPGRYARTYITVPGGPA